MARSQTLRPLMDEVEQVIQVGNAQGHVAAVTRLKGYLAGLGGETLEGRVAVSLLGGLGNNEGNRP